MNPEQVERSIFDDSKLAVQQVSVATLDPLKSIEKVTENSTPTERKRACVDGLFFLHSRSKNKSLARCRAHCTIPALISYAKKTKPGRDSERPIRGPRTSPSAERPIRRRHPSATHRSCSRRWTERRSLGPFMKEGTGTPSCLREEERAWSWPGCHLAALDSMARVISSTRRRWGL